MCVVCRRIRDIEIAEMDQLLGANPSLEGYETLGWSLEIQALCDNCRAQTGVRPRTKKKGEKLS